MVSQQAGPQNNGTHLSLPEHKIIIIIIIITIINVHQHRACRREGYYYYACKD